jgi:hypothetical protein
MIEVFCIEDRRTDLGGRGYNRGAPEQLLRGLWTDGKGALSMQIMQGFYVNAARAFWSEAVARLSRS